MYLLIVKNILFFIWSFEYYILKDKTKITKLYVIEDVNLEFGYHIYDKNINEYDAYDTFEWLVSEKDLKDYQNNFNFLNDWNENAYIVNESIYILSCVDVSESNLLVYIDNKNNKNLKDIIQYHKKYFSKFRINQYPNNNVDAFKTEIAQKYFTELKNIIAEFQKEWERSYMNEKEILEKRQVLLELINHSKKICV
jgi:hypothetical protein